MNANPLATASPTTAIRFDAKFIEDNHLIERYLDRKLPAKGARELEAWCRLNPRYLDGLKLAERAEASLKLLDEAGRTVDLGEAKTPWWQRPSMSLAAVVIMAVTLLAFWALYTRFSLVRAELADTRTALAQGSLIQPPTLTDLRVAPDRSADVSHARIAVKRSVPQLIDLHVDMNYVKAMQFRLVVDKRDQGRALIVNDILKDSNGELRLTFNTTGLAAGAYVVRIEALPLHGAPTPEGWLELDVT